MEEIIEQQSVSPVSESVPVKNIPKVVLFVFLAIFFGAGLVFAGIEIGKKQTPVPLVSQSTVVPTSLPTAIPTSNETANWKTYTNSNIGFSFKYPKAWTENGPVSKEDTTIVYIYADEKFGEMPDPLQYYVWVSEINKLPNLDYAKESVGKYTAYKTDKWPSRFGALTYFITKDGNKYIAISLTPYDSSKPYPAQERYIGIFDQILSTFKFTSSQNAVDETANWKTYVNEQYGFSFKYPENQFNKSNPIKGNPMGCQKLDATGCVNAEGYGFGVIKSCSDMDCENFIDVNVYLNPDNATYKRDMGDMTGLYLQTIIIDSNLGGLPAKKRVYNNLTGSLYGQIFYVTTNKYSFVIYGSPTDPVSNQILSTFKFLN